MHMAAEYWSDFIINVAMTGAVSDPRKNPNVPTTENEIVAQAVQCRAEGAAIGHFHVRDENGRPSTDPDRFARIFDRLRSHPVSADMILCATTSGRHGQTMDQRSAVLTLPRDFRPDMASLTLSSLNFANGASINDPAAIRKLCELMLTADIKPELEIFDVGMAEFSHVLVQEGLLRPPLYANILLGNIAGARATPCHLAAILASLPDQTVFCLAGIGRSQLQSNILAVAVANGVRVGLEDNLWLDVHRTPATNVDLVKRIAEISRLAQRSLATPTLVRKLLKLNRIARDREQAEESKRGSQEPIKVLFDSPRMRVSR
jgi:uncharacterized protein (DUF849 family)